MVENRQIYEVYKYFMVMIGGKIMEFNSEFKPDWGLVKENLEKEEEKLNKIVKEILRWVPVKERLPEEDGRYLVSFKYNPDVHVFFFAKDIKEYCDNNIGGFGGCIIKNGNLVMNPISGFFDLGVFENAPEEYSAFVDNGHITAWMPLPEAYKEV